MVNQIVIQIAKDLKNASKKNDAPIWLKLSKSALKSNSSQKTINLKKIHDKIETLKKSSVSTGIDVAASIEELEKKLLSEKHKIYSNLSRWQRLEIARHPNRPYSSDYIESITDNWI